MTSPLKPLRNDDGLDFIHDGEFYYFELAKFGQWGMQRLGNIFYQGVDYRTIEIDGKRTEVEMVLVPSGFAVARLGRNGKKRHFCKAVGSSGKPRYLVRALEIGRCFDRYHYFTLLKEEVILREDGTIEFVA